jgi:RimJ/RimL family protein N-acetyltransferase
MTAPVAFRRLEEADLPQLHQWLNEPGVATWWEGEDVSWSTVRRHYWEQVEPGIEHWLALDPDGHPFGWIQCYPVTVDLDACGPWFEYGIDRSAAAGIDYVVGAPTDRGRGRGSAMLDAFVAEVVFGRHPGWTQVCADPSAANEASWRALAKVGFRHVGTIDGHDGPGRLMMRARGSDQVAPA